MSMCYLTLLCSQNNWPPTPLITCSDRAKRGFCNQHSLGLGIGALHMHVFLHMCANSKLFMLLQKLLPRHAQREQPRCSQALSSHKCALFARERGRDFRACFGERDIHFSDMQGGYSEKWSQCRSALKLHSFLWLAGKDSTGCKKKSYCMVVDE